MIKKSFMTFLALISVFTVILALNIFGSDEISYVSSLVINEKTGKVVEFTLNDFTENIKGNNKLDAIIISNVPEKGFLSVGESLLSVGDTVSADEINDLKFYCENDVETVDVFWFKPVFSKTGIAEEDVSVTISLSDKPNNTPVAVNSKVKTYANIKLVDVLSAVDVDGDECSFTIVKKPKKGVVTIEGNKFYYTPNENKTGKDSFTFKATDVKGAISNEATVTIEICKASSKNTFSYSDMTDSSAHYAALYLREKGIMCGETFGAENFFYPDSKVTRAQFIALVATVSEMSMPTVSVGTGLYDNEEIPDWAKSYVAAAINCGVVSGTTLENGNKVFRANDYITRAEAAAILDRAIGLTNDNRTVSFADMETVPTWAEQSIVNTVSSGILSTFDDNTVRAGDDVTREDAASMLYEALCYIEKKDKSKSFWQKLFD